MNDQMIFEELARRFKELGYRVYSDWIVDEHAECPYIQMTYSNETTSLNKYGNLGTSYIIVNLWHDRLDERGMLQKILDDILSVSMTVKIGEHEAHLSSFSSRTLIDTTTATPYLHGVADLSFKHD